MGVDLISKSTKRFQVLQRIQAVPHNSTHPIQVERGTRVATDNVPDELNRILFTITDGPDHGKKIAFLGGIVRISRRGYGGRYNSAYLKETH